MDVFSLLKQDHRRVKTDLESLIGDCKKGGDINFARVEACREDLLLHMTLEEELLYPKAREIKKASNIIKDSYEEHREVRELFGKVEKDTIPEKLGQYLDKILDEVEHHVEEEETTLFPILQENWSQDEIKDLSDQILDMKERKTGVKR